MKKVKVLSILVLSAIVLAACGGGNKKEEKAGVATAKTSANVSESSATEETEVVEKANSDSVVERQEYASEWSEDWNGLVSKVTKVVLVEITDVEKEEKMLDSNFLTQVYFEVNNTSDKDFNTYPDQATLVISGQQVEADMFGSDHIGGEIMAGVTKQGMVTFQIPNPIKVSEIHDIRLKWSSDYNTDNYEEDSHKDFDVSLNLTK